MNLFLDLPILKDCFWALGFCLIVLDIVKPEEKKFNDFFLISYFYSLFFTLPREDTHKKVFFSGRNTKGAGRVNPPEH